MGRLAADSSEVQRIDAALKAWRQGDLALEEKWFVHLGDPVEPLSEAAEQAEGEGVQALTSDAEGLIVVTQTCDIVRSCLTRPYVEVAPLMKVSGEDLRTVQRGLRPAHATLSCLAYGRLVADLDRVMTVEKSIVSGWVRTPGCSNDAESRVFAQALSRKRERFAFPDDFVRFAKKLKSRLEDKHGKSTDEGGGLRALREIRVQASPSWGASRVELFFWFVRNGVDVQCEGKSWASLLQQWMKLVPESERFSGVEGRVVALEDMTAAQYVDSDPLDLDHLSGDPP